MKANLVSNANSRIRWAYLLWVPLNAKAKLAGLTERFHGANFGPARRGRQ